MNRKHTLNSLELKAVRQTLGLTVAEAAELCGGVSKRSFQYWEAGRTPVPLDVADNFSNLAVQYNLVLYCLTRDIDAHKEKNYSPVDNSDIHSEVIKDKTLVLPFFHTFNLWQEKTGNQLPHFWKIYQSVIGNFLLTGKINKLDDNVDIPNNFSILEWLDNDNY